MFSRTFQLSAFFFFVFGVLSCSKTPAQRSLPGPSPLPIDSIRLGPKLGVLDFKKIFVALNRDNQLESFRPWFENVPEKDLEDLAKVISYELYETNFDHNGLLSLISHRSAQKGFTDWKEKKPFSDPGLKTLLWNYLYAPEFLSLFPSHKNFLDLSIQKRLQNLPQFAKNYPNEEGPFPSIQIQRLSGEIRTLLSQDEFQKEGVAFFQKLSEKHLSERLLQALSKTREKDPQAFLAFSKTLATLSYPEQPEGEEIAPAKFESMLQTLKALDTRPEGFFKLAGNYLRENSGYQKDIANKLQPALLATLFEQTQRSLRKTLPPELLIPLVREDKNSLPTEAFKVVLTRVRDALQLRFAGSNSPNSVLNLYAYLITRTLEEVSRKNLGKLKLEKTEALWTLPLQISPLKIQFSEGTPRKLSSDIQRDLEACEMQPTIVVLNTQLSHIELFPKTVYSLPQDLTIKSLDEILLISLERTFFVKPLVEPTFLLNSLLESLDIASLESKGNILTVFISLLSRFQADELEDFDRIFFHQFKLQDFPPETLFEMYGGNETLTGKVSQALKGLKLLHEFHHAGGKVSGLKLPWMFLNELGFDLENLTAFNHFFRMLRASELFQLEHQNLFPEMLKVLRNPNHLSQGLWALSQFSSSDYEIFSQKLPWKDWEKNGALLKRLAQTAPREFDLGLSKVLEENFSLFPTENTLTEAERDWLLSFSQSSRFSTLGNLLKKHASRQNVKDLVRDLKALSAKGEWAKILDYFSRIQNERLYQLASLLSEMEKNGEWLALLNLLEEIH